MSDDLESLLASLESEPVAEIDWNAPESGSFPPTLYPGRHRFIFHLAEQDAFDKVDIQGKPYLNVTFEAEVRPPDLADSARIRFLRASTFKTSPTRNSDVVELLRCLGLRPADNSNRAIVETLKQADGRASGEAVFGWEAYSKDTKEVISTSPRKKARKDSGKTDIPWPKEADGRYSLVVKFPESGDSVYGRERIISFKLPHNENGTQVA